MSTKRTPGPWAVHRASDRDRALIVPAAHAERWIGGSSSMQHDRDDYAQQICNLYEDAHKRRDTLADARRIVQCVNAYDDLLDALAEIAEGGEAWTREGLVSIAKNAIAKATGAA